MPQDREQRVLLAEEVNRILQSQAWKLAYFEVRRRYFNALLVADVGTLTAQAAHASMKALEDVVAQLKSFDTDEKLSRRKQGTR